MAKTPRCLCHCSFQADGTRARAGVLEGGDQAPDVSLETLDTKAKVKLSALRGKSPVVLIFGSYT
jgi:hypothetical protein